MANEDYRYQARNVAGFISQIVRYIRHGGHYFYVRCVIPEGKDPQAIAEKLIARYDVRRKRWQRKRSNLKHTASIHYLAFGQVFVIMLSKGRHARFYDDHGGNVADIRRHALKVLGYSIRFAFSEVEKRWKVSVRLDAETYRKLKAHMLTIAVWDSYRDKNRLEREFSRLPYEPYGPVYEQLLSILRQVNRVRRRRGFAPVDPSCIRKYRRLSKVFIEPECAVEVRQQSRLTAADRLASGPTHKGKD
jgi:hypothetical protein